MIDPNNLSADHTAPHSPAPKRRQRRRTQLMQLPQQLAAPSASEPAPQEPAPAPLPPRPDQREAPPDPLTLIRVLGLLTSAAAAHLQEPDRETAARYLGLVERVHKLCSAILEDANAIDPLRDLDIEINHPFPRGRA